MEPSWNTAPGQKRNDRQLEGGQKEEEEERDDHVGGGGWGGGERGGSAGRQQHEPDGSPGCSFHREHRWPITARSFAENSLLGDLINSRQLLSLR